MNTKPVIRRLLVMSLLSVFVCSSFGQAQQDDSAFLTEKEHRLDNYQKDFLNFAKYNDNAPHLEYEIAMDLRAIAYHNSDRVYLAHTLFHIFSGSQCTKDHALAQFFMRTRFEYLSREIEYDLKSVDSDLANTRVPAISQTAINMKNDLRELQEKLEALSKD
jgi:hypothetical protein